MGLSKREILLQLIDYYANGNKSQFARKVGITSQVIANWLNRDMFDTEAIFSNCENVSAEWLLTGEGEMLKTPVSLNNSGVIVGGGIRNSPIDIDNRHYYSDSPDVLRAQIEMLDDRIKEKDAQIKEKDAQIKSLLEILHKQ